MSGHVKSAQAQASALQGEFVVLDHWIREKIPAKFVQSSLCVRGFTVDFNLHKLANPHRLHGAHSVMLHGVAHRHSLGVKDTLFWHDDDLGFHGAARLWTSAESATEKQ